MIAVGVRQEVQLANVGGVIAVWAEQVREHQPVFGHRHPHVRDPRRRRVLPGEKTHPARHAQRMLHEVVIEVESILRQPV
jgi:hypothetical protein